MNEAYRKSLPGTDLDYFDASAAVNALPESLRSQSPWIRPVGDVQQVIR